LNDLRGNPEKPEDPPTGGWRFGTDAQIAAYRRVLKRRYGIQSTPQERAFDGASMVNIEDIKL